MMNSTSVLSKNNISVDLIVVSRAYFENLKFSQNFHLYIVLYTICPRIGFLYTSRVNIIKIWDFFNL